MPFDAKLLSFPARNAKQTATAHFAAFLKANRVDADLGKKAGKPEQAVFYYTNGQDVKSYAEAFLSHYPEYAAYRHVIYLVPSHPERLAVEFAAKK